MAGSGIHCRFPLPILIKYHLWIVLNAASRPARKAAMFCSTIFLSLGSETPFMASSILAVSMSIKGDAAPEKHEIGTADGGYALGLFIHVESHNAGLTCEFCLPTAVISG